MQKSESIKELATALATAQAEVENASKNAANPHFRSKYADLAEVINTVRPVFSKHGLSVTQWPSFADGVASVETVLMHKSGEWMSQTASAPVSKQDAQGVGSAITYLRRYSLAAVAGVAQEDDDANGAVGAAKPAKSEANISDAQLSTLRDMIAATESNESAFAKVCGVAALELLPAVQFSKALDLLKNKLAKMQGADNATS